MLDNVNMVNKIYNTSACSDFNYLHIINAVERFNKYFEEKQIEPRYYKTHFQSLDIVEQFNEGKKIFGIYFTRLYLCYMDCI